MGRRVLLFVMVAGVVFASTAAAHASCLAPPPLVPRYQEAGTAATMVLVDRAVLAPELPPTREPTVWPGPPAGPLMRFFFRVVRVYKGGDRDLTAGTVLTRTERVFSAESVEPIGTREAHFLARSTTGWKLSPRGWGECAGVGSFTPEQLRQAALLDRYAKGRNAESFGCDLRGDACWSIKRSGRDILLRTAGYDPGSTYDLCVRAPDRSRTCREFSLDSDTGNLRSSRVRWSRHFPDGGPGVYHVTWNVPGALTYPRPRLGYFSPRLTFRR